MDETVDLLSICKEGMTLRTRDGGQARITGVAPSEGLIHGEVAMFGPCAWSRDGVYACSPCGAAGPLDLLPPDTTGGRERPRKTARLRDALSAENRFFCCD